MLAAHQQRPLGARCSGILNGAIVLLFLPALITAAGCWEEIHYAPVAESPSESNVAAGTTPTQPEHSEPPAAESESAADSPVVSAEAPPAEPPPPPSTSDLFAAQTPPPEAETDAAIVPTPEETATPPLDTADIPAAPPTPTPATTAERHQAWQAASKWSLAAAIYAKGLAGDPHAPILEEAAAAAAELGVQLPAMPTAASAENLQATVIEGLRGELAVALTNAYANRFGPAEAAAADLAIRSHLLLLTYLPRSADAELDAEALRRSGEASGLSAELWEPLVTLVHGRSPFLEVRQAVFDLHRRTAAHLAAAAAP